MTAIAHEEDLLELFDDPPRAALRAAARRNKLLGDRVEVRPTPSHPRPECAALLRSGDVSACEPWPAIQTLDEGDALVIVVPASPEGRAKFARYLLELAKAPSCNVAPISSEPAGLHSLWCIAAARLALPGSIRVEARHDLIGMHLAQVGLGFGADTLSGPVAESRHLPLAGTTRPTESSREGLFTLVRQAGLNPVDPPPAP